MAAPARTPPAGNHTDTADILAAIHELGERMERRFVKIETNGTELKAEQQRQGERQLRMGEDVAELKAEQRRQGERQQKTGEDVAELKGRTAGIEGQLRQIPTLWQIAGLIFAIFAAAFVLIRGAGGHG